MYQLSTPSSGHTWTSLLQASTLWVVFLTFQKTCLHRDSNPCLLDDKQQRYRLLHLVFCVYWFGFSLWTLSRVCREHAFLMLLVTGACGHLPSNAKRSSLAAKALSTLAVDIKCFRLLTSLSSLSISLHKWLALVKIYQSSLVSWKSIEPFRRYAYLR